MSPPERTGKPGRPTVTRDRRERTDPHDPSVPENVVPLRPAEIHNSPPGRRGPARDAAARHRAGPPVAVDVATGRRVDPSPGRVPGGLGTGGPAAREPGASAGPGPHEPPGRRAPGAPRRLGLPVPVTVQAGAGGRPLRIDRSTVDAVRESWLIEDRWWTDRPLRRRYWEVVTTSGRDSIVFRDLVDGRWYRQR